ncbi:MAG: efflux RND transporter periplasmic adaptor subunit [Gammaproteobacteria bacterium]|nr:MAG: efflux RND transporter periplasmic adaptor subunit [Gammaproteobacteria bacterium]
MEAISQTDSAARRRSVTNAKSGVGMDRIIAKKKLPPKNLAIAAIVVTMAVVIGWYLYNQSSGRSLVIENSRVVISPVTEGLFEDFIPIRSRVTPKKTVYLDIIEGGQVEQRLVDDGAMLKAGDLIVVLNNTSLQLEVARNEALVMEQLNNMRTIELQLEQNRLAHKRNIVELNYQIKRLDRQVERFSNLDNAGVAAKSQLEDARDELEYYTNLRIVTLESQETDARLQGTQLEFLRTSGNQLKNNLVFARKNLDALNVRAPVDGKLSGLDVEVGQSIPRGGRVGQIDDPYSFKLRADIDEFYLGRVDTGQAANFEKDGQQYETIISKIYPQVNNGQFAVDLQFTGDEPKGIRRGQTIQARLTLGDSNSALLIPNGAFFQDTGGNWMFVVSPDGSEAVKRNVKLGRRNSRHIEVLDGLELGEEVVTSPYSSFKEMDRLQLTDE